MKLICDLLEIGMRLTVKKNEAKYREIWLAEAMTSAWEVLIRMGWSGDIENCIRTHDWSSFDTPEQKSVVMNMICRFNRIARENRLNVLHQFDKGWVLILKIIANVDQNDLWFEAAPEVISFRKTVAFFITFAINRGCNSSSPCNHEQFIFPVRQIILIAPVRTLPDFPIEIETFGDDTVVSITDPIKLDFTVSSHALYIASV